MSFPGLQDLLLLKEVTFTGKVPSLCASSGISYGIKSGGMLTQKNSPPCKNTTITHPWPSLNNNAH
jgi:hypothetical protein